MARIENVCNMPQIAFFNTVAITSLRLIFAKGSAFFHFRRPHLPLIPLSGQNQPYKLKNRVKSTRFSAKKQYLCPD